MVLMIHYLDIWDTQITQWSLSNLKVHIFQNWCIIYIYICVYICIYDIHIYILYTVYMSVCIYVVRIKDAQLNMLMIRKVFLFQFWSRSFIKKPVWNWTPNKKAARKVMWMPHVDLTIKITQAGHKASPLALEIAPPSCPASRDFDHILEGNANDKPLIPWKSENCIHK